MFRRWRAPRNCGAGAGRRASLSFKLRAAAAAGRRARALSPASFQWPGSESVAGPRRGQRVPWHPGPLGPWQRATRARKAPPDRDARRATQWHARQNLNFKVASEVRPVPGVQAAPGGPAAQSSRSHRHNVLPSGVFNALSSSYQCVPCSATIPRRGYQCLSMCVQSQATFFWKASLSIELPLTAHGPIHPQVSSRPQPLVNQVIMVR